MGFRQPAGTASGLYPLNKYQIPERGARMARRDDRAYREYVREKQRRQPGCPARKLVLDQRIQATGPGAILREQSAPALEPHRSNSGQIRLFIRLRDASPEVCRRWLRVCCCT